MHRVRVRQCHETDDIAFADGRVTEIGHDRPVGDAKIVDVRGLIVVPGLIDLHTHVYWGGTSLGVDAIEIARRSGTTTFVDAGSEVLIRLRRGDILAHCFRPFPNAPVQQDGRIREEVLEARRRGVMSTMAWSGIGAQGDLQARKVH